MMAIPYGGSARGSDPANGDDQVTAPLVVDPSVAGALRVHVIGAGGSGMSSLAIALSGMGHEVTGCDLKPSQSLDHLQALGIAVSVGHDERHLLGSGAGEASPGAGTALEGAGEFLDPRRVNLVTASSAVDRDHIELQAARSHGIRTVTRAGILAAIGAMKSSVAVAGTHGKTTTSSMLSVILVEAGWHPSFLIGGEVNEIGSSALWDSGEWLVIEADESDGTFLELSPDVAVVTNVEPDHLEHYGGMAGLNEAFSRFMRFARDRDGLVVVGVDDMGARSLVPAGRKGRVVAFGMGGSEPGSEPGVDGSSDQHIARWDTFYSGTVSYAGGAESLVSISRDGVVMGEVTLAVPGLHNVRNALAAAAVAGEIGVPFEAIQNGLERFAGVARRFENRGEAGGVRFIDDYAHLPGEVSAALSAARLLDAGRVVCVFQPHRYSRTERLWASFGSAFDGADILVVTDVYPAGELPKPGVTGDLVAGAVRSHRPGMTVGYVPDRHELVDYLVALLRPGDVCLTLGAGDLTTIPDTLKERVR